MCLNVPHSGQSAASWICLQMHSQSSVGGWSSNMCAASFSPRRTETLRKSCSNGLALRHARRAILGEHQLPPKPPDPLRLTCAQTAHRPNQPSGPEEDEETNKKLAPAPAHANNLHVLRHLRKTAMLLVNN